MSTTIYNAWEWLGTFDDLVKWFNNTKNTTWYQDSKNLIEKFNPNQDEDRWTFERRIIKELEDAKRSSEKSFFDVDMSAVVIQHKDKIVVCFFGLNEHIFPITVKEINSKFRYFGWWNNTDPEEGISEEEWDYRGEWFEEVFEKYESEVYAEIGLTYEFSTSTMIFKLCNEVAYKKYDKRRMGEETR